MKRFLLVMVTAILLVMYASPSEAWKVNITNSCSSEVEIFVNGQHLVYDNQTDCTVKVPSGETRSCAMPGGICPSSIYGRYFVKDVFGRTYEKQLTPIECRDTGGFKMPTCCWDVNLEVTQPLGTCRLERR